MEFDFEKFKEMTCATGEHDAEGLLMFRSDEEVHNFKMYLIENKIGFSGYGLDQEGDFPVGVFWNDYVYEVWGLFPSATTTLYTMDDLQMPQFFSSEKELLDFIFK